ncbi:P-loop containing nucleoside triphosphate hydrolase protein [Chaetomium strumarium]|uniref:P-loop containing nucleoside triphosphate hydrolase protein n=1 Tax=Chaetomium strumarium TaxID=1170767 RepID=A0AAJ0GUR4_9PEZI|nr:P-loop containing nucleoside triphosphate hydrolase protein [Chaetomium strumarium]
MSTMSRLSNSSIAALQPTVPSTIAWQTNASTNLRPVPPLKIFPSIEEFVRRHKEGTEAEFAAEQKRVDAINKEQLKFKAWVLLKARQTAKRSEYLVIVDPGKDERKIAQQGEPAKLRIVFNDESVTRFFDARRVESPMLLASGSTASLGNTAITARSLEKLAFFQVTIHVAEAHHGKSEESTLPPLATDLLLGDDNAVRVNFLLTASDVTKNAELAAINQLYGRHVGATERQLQAFEYFVLFRNPRFVVNLHERIPHMATAMREPLWPGSRLAKSYESLNFAQRLAYIGFRNLRCGICILPGCPGAGKTHFNLFTIAMAQSRPLPTPVRVGHRLEKRCAKVLYIVDMNSPVDDVANRAVRLYEELGMTKSVIRMKGWGAEVALSNRLNAAEDAASGDPITVDFTNQFLRTANLMLLGHGSGNTRSSCNAPSLDEAAWQYYDSRKETQYEELTKFLKGELWEENEVIPLRFRRCVYNLYRDTLAAADFIATTPVAASNHFRGLFKPDLVFFDESPHARELSNLIAIANFNPIAWVFCGDYRQTMPYVGSESPGCRNVYRGQMQISMMERAAAANKEDPFCAIQHELFINHRAFGGLEQLASQLWYDGKMKSAHGTRTPASLLYVRKFLERYMDYWSCCTVPRLLVHVKDCGPEGRDGTSAWNPTHAAWVMARVGELLNDKEFKQADRDEPGTVLIISPYRKAYREYKNAIKKLPHWAQSRVETRTVDVVQGHEADFVFVDLVKEVPTRFVDNANRLCVALTRARQGEVVLMHPKMVQAPDFRRTTNLRRIYDLCVEKQQVVYVEKEWTTATVLGRQPKSPAESTATSPATATSMVTSAVSMSDRPMSHAQPVTSPNKDLATSIHSSTTSTTSGTGKPGSCAPETTIAPTVAVNYEPTSPAGNEAGPESLVSELGRDMERKLVIREVHTRDVGKDEQVKNEEAKNEEAKNEEAKNEEAKNEEAKNEKAMNEEVEGALEKVELVEDSVAVTTTFPWEKAVSEHPWTRSRGSRATAIA